MNIPRTLNSSSLQRHFRITSGWIDNYFISYIHTFNFSQSAIDELEKEIKQLKQKLSQHEDERSLLRERLNEVELEFRQAIDDRASTIAMHEQHLQGLIQERNALAEQQQLQSDQRYVSLFVQFRCYF